MSTSPLELVREYLTAAGERRLKAATSYLDSDAVLIFPQGRFKGLDEMAAAMKDHTSSEIHGELQRTRVESTRSIKLPEFMKGLTNANN